MKVLVQRVKKTSCEINGKVVSQIDKGLLVFVGVEKSDSFEEAKQLAHKCANLRVFDDKNGKMNLSVKDVEDGKILVISQFTLCADCKKGLRPGFDNSAPPEQAKEIYNKFIESISSEGIETQQGVFREYMNIGLINDGPVTFILSS